MADDAERREQRLNDVVTAVAEQRCVLFLGAGGNHGATDAKGNPLPCSGTDLAKRIANEFGVQVPDWNLSVVCEYVEAVRGKASLHKYVRDLFADAIPPPHLRELPKYHWPAIYTTNYDRLVESIYGECADARQRLYPIVSSQDNVSALAVDDLPIYKLHGCITRPSEKGAELVLSRRDYTRVLVNRQQMLRRLSEHRGAYTVLYVGHSISDSDLLAVLHELDETVGRDYLPRAYCLMPGHSAQDEQVLEQWKITLLDFDAAAFFERLAGRFETVAREIEGRPVSTHRRVECECEDAVRRLDRRTQAVIAGNHEILSPNILRQPSNERNFFKGDRPSWGIFVRELDAKRSLYDGVMSELLDHYDDKVHGPRCVLVTSDAGAGKSVFIRRLAFDLVADWQAPVLFTHDAAEIEYDALEALGTALGKRLFLFVDRASRHANDILYVLRRAQGVGLKITLVCAERANEWHSETRNLPVRGVTEHVLERLDETEIQSVLDVMGKAGMLGALELLSPDERFRQIAERADKQLLVALREATEGKGFDDIIADEFHSLPSREAQECYEVVCAFHAVGAPIRLSILQRLTDIPYGEFGRLVFGPAEGVIVPADDGSDPQGPYVGESYRSRHETIARVVFRTCLTSDEERLRVLRSAIPHLDPGQQGDRTAIRRLTDSIAGLEGVGGHSGRSSLFETLAGVDSRNVFVWQHWALMEMDAGHSERAQELIDRALELRSQDTHLLHSKAMILAQRAHATEDAIRKERLYREANEIFEFCKKKDPRSSYPYHAHARMFYERASRAQSSAEQLKYVREGYRVINEGLRACPNKAILHQQLGEVFEKFFQNYQQSRDAFDRALAADRRDVTSRYLYARMEYRQKDYLKASRILDQALTIDSNDSNCLYWRARCEEGIDFDNEAGIISLYERARTQSQGDTHMAFREACYLYRRNHCERARAVFAANDLQGIPYSDAVRPRLRFSEPGGDAPVRFRGTVVNKGSGHAFLRRDGYGDDVYASIRDVPPEIRQNLQVGGAVSFAVCFNLRGPMAYDIRPAR